MERLALEEEAEHEITGEGEGEVGFDLSLCLVGRFLMNKSIKVNVIMDNMADISRPGRGVGIKEVEPELFLFKYQLDIQRIMKQGQKVHDLPIGFMSEAVGKGLGDFIGEFLESDGNNSSNFWRQYMQIRVLIDVRQPLRRAKKIKKQGGEARMVTFIYERLEVFCYLCCLLGHMESESEKLFSLMNDDDRRGRGPNLRAEIRRGGGGSRSRWLRDETQTDWRDPNKPFNAGGNRGNVTGGLMRNNRREGAGFSNFSDRWGQWCECESIRRQKNNCGRTGLFGG